jgi:transposase-like protein
VIEELPCRCELRKEVEELKKLYPGYRDGGAIRLSFFISKITSLNDIKKTNPGEYLGYAIIRKDILPDHTTSSHIFESVFIKYGHLHNFIPKPTEYTAACDTSEFTVQGVMYCQQNSLNKACAQVALRSLLSTQIPTSQICYSDINRIANVRTPSKGLSSRQIRKVFDAYNIRYEDIDYDSVKNEDERRHIREKIPYNHFIYAGMESGCGGLVGFEFSDGESKHIIPFFGHTFNQDTWAPMASNAYFRIGKQTKYIPSDEWLSSFIGHDDNFGSNFCIPRKFIQPEQVKYVMSILPYNVPGSPLKVEALAVDFLYKTYSEIKPDTAWGQRWENHIKKQDTVVRPLLLAKHDYLKYLKLIRDWDFNKEYNTIIEKLAKILPDYFWMVELSLPELYSANYSKIGELIMTVNNSQIDLAMLRIPGKYSFTGKSYRGKFFFFESGLKSHVPLYTHTQGLLDFGQKT